MRTILSITVIHCCCITKVTDCSSRAKRFATMTTSYTSIRIYNYWFLIFYRINSFLAFFKASGTSCTFFRINNRIPCAAHNVMFYRFRDFFISSSLGTYPFNFTSPSTTTAGKDIMLYFIISSIFSSFFKSAAMLLSANTFRTDS